MKTHSLHTETPGSPPPRGHLLRWVRVIPQSVPAPERMCVFTGRRGPSAAPRQHCPQAVQTALLSRPWADCPQGQLRSARLTAAHGSEGPFLHLHSVFFLCWGREARGPESPPATRKTRLVSGPEPRGQFVAAAMPSLTWHPLCPPTYLSGPACLPSGSGDMHPTRLLLPSSHPHLARVGCCSPTDFLHIFLRGPHCSAPDNAAHLVPAQTLPPRQSSSGPRLRGAVRGQPLRQRLCAAHTRPATALPASPPLLSNPHCVHTI